MNGIRLLLPETITCGIFGLLFKKHPLAQWTVLVCGIILMLWIVLEWWIWGFNAISNLYFVFGLVEAIAAFRMLRCQRWFSLLCCQRNKKGVLTKEINK